MGDNGRYVGIDQVGIVELGDDVDVGANTTIDRARFGRTVIGEGTKIDNLVQIGHNVVVGKHCIIVALSGIAGSTHVGDYVTIAAQVGIAGHLKIGSKSTLAAPNGRYRGHSGKRSLLGHSRLTLQGCLPPICGPQETSGPHQGSPFLQKEAGFIRKLGRNKAAGDGAAQAPSLCKHCSGLPRSPAAVKEPFQR